MTFRTYPVKSRFFNIIYSIGLDNDQRIFTVVCFWRGFQLNWDAKPTQVFEWSLFK